MRRWVLRLGAGLLVVAAVAGVARTALDDGAQSREARIQAIAATLRCPTCDNLSVADSPEAMAGSMRQQIADQLDEGRSPDQIREWFVDRYGTWILLNPPGEGVGWLVWLAPVAALAFAGTLGIWLLRGRHRSPPGQGVATDLLDQWRGHGLSLPDSFEGERVEAAVTWLDEAEEDPTTSRRAREAAERELATAWQALQTDGSKAGRHRALGWGTGALVLAVAVAAALPAAITARGMGQVATGGAPVEDEGSTPAGPGPGDESQVGGAGAPEATTAELLAELERLAATEDDPQDAAAAVDARLPTALSQAERLNMVLAMLRQDHLAGAEALATSILTDEPQHLEATLLRGLALAARDDEASTRWLRRFLDAAPVEHPGRPIAEAALSDPGRRR